MSSSHSGVFTYSLYYVALKVRVTRIHWAFEFYEAF